MAGLNFQTQTIINSNFDPDSGKKLFVKGGSLKDSYVKILRDFLFYKDKEGYGKTLRVVKKDGHDASMCKATINFNGLNLTPSEGIKYYRLDIYLGVEGAEPFILSNPWVQKGMPFWIEFSVKKGETAAPVVAKLAKAIKDADIFTCGKELIKVDIASSPSMTLTGAEEFLRFKEINIVEIDEKTGKEVLVAGIGNPNITIDDRGVNGFGTYSQIIKDLRLPTAANWQPTHIRQVETPIIGAIYDQFIIDYEAPATNDGLACVGQRMNSVTTHVFWVKHDIAEEFNTAVTTLIEGGSKVMDKEAIETPEVSDDTNMTSAETVIPDDLDHSTL